jgi:hypothetical protein
MRTYFNDIFRIKIMYPKNKVNIKHLKLQYEISSFYGGGIWRKGIIWKSYNRRHFQRTRLSTSKSIFFKNINKRWRNEKPMKLMRLMSLYEFKYFYVFSKKIKKMNFIKKYKILIFQIYFYLAWNQE